MKQLLLLFLLIQSAAFAQSIDTAHYLTKPVPATMRTDTAATNLLTYNQTTHIANLMSGATLKSYFQNGLLTRTQYATLSARIVADSVLATGKISSITAGNGIAITGAGTIASPYVVSIVQPTVTFPTRPVNSNFTISTTKSAFVSYSVLCSVTNPLIAGSSSATVTLQYSINGGTTFQDVAQIGNLSSVALAVTVQLTNGQTGDLFGIIPANALVRINSVTTGTASVSVPKTQEGVY